VGETNGPKGYKTIEMPETTKQVRKIPNPTGKGGFQERPQDRSDGRWSKENSFSYWMNFFKQLDKEEFLTWEKDNPKHSMAASLAYARVFKSRSELKEFQEVANRTEGMPTQRTEHSGPEGGPIPIADIETLNRIYGHPIGTPSDPSKGSGSSSEST